MLNPLTVPLLGPPRIEKLGCAPNGSVHESETATEPPPCGPVAETLLHTGRVARTRTPPRLMYLRARRSWPSGHRKPAHAVPKKPKPVSPEPVSLCCCGPHPGRPREQVGGADHVGVAMQAPIRAVLPSPRGQRRCRTAAVGPLASLWEELRPAGVQVAPGPVNTQAAPPIGVVVVRSADQRGVAVGRQGDRAAEPRSSPGWPRRWDDQLPAAAPGRPLPRVHRDCSRTGAVVGPPMNAVLPSADRATARAERGSS